MSDIAAAARESLAADRAVRNAADDRSQARYEKFEEKTCDLICQVPALCALLNSVRLPQTGIAGSPRRLIGRLPFLPRSVTLTEKGSGRTGWPIAEVNVVVRLPLWRRVARRFKIGQNRHKGPSVTGAQGVLLLADGSLWEYFWLESKKWIVIGHEYKVADGCLPRFIAPDGYGRLLSRFPRPDQEISAERWAASLDAGMFNLAKAAEREIA
jgi:hypothetical protein